MTVLVCGCRVFEDEAYLELDAEDQARVLQLVQQHCELVVRRFDGTTVQCNEQGLLACFGYPVAFEDAALRAARTGLGLIESLQSLADELRHQHQLELQPWCTIHTGPAVVEANADGISLVGEARHIALRLESVAVPGHVICTDDTHRLFRSRANCTGLGDRRIKGVARPIDLFSIQSVDESRSVFERAASSGLSPLAGRDLEVSLLKERWERAQDGLGQVVLLIGEPGLGKSRLVHTLKEHVLGPLVEGTVDAPVIEWRCSPQFQNTGLFPAIDFYERALSIDREEPPQARFDRLLRRLELYDLAHPETVPLWASLLSLPTPDTFPPLSLTPVRQREETFRAMIDWLHTRAARRPVLFVVEDLHWVDASTLEFLGKFLAEGQYDRILTVLTCRPEFQAPWPAVENLTSLALSRLTRRQAGELMRRQAGEQISEALIEQIYDRSGGVPLFVEEFTKMIRDSKTLQEPAAVGSGSAVLPAHEIPATLQDLISARLDRMKGAHELAQLAATLGREFSHEWIAAVAATDGANLQSELDSLVKAEVLLQKGRPPRCTYMFKHALLEDALYNALIKEKRQGCHRRIAETFAAKFPQTADSRPELLAHHFTEAGETQQAIGFWLKAGLRSKRQSADVEAIAHLLQGRRLLDATPESPERDRRELEFVTALGSSYIAVRGYAAPEIGPVLQRACELAQRVGDSGQQFGIMLGMWEWRLVRGDLRLAVDLAADGMALAERLNDPGMRMEALFMEGTTHYYRGQFAAARGCFEQALAAYDDRERTKFWCAYSGHDAGVTHRCYLAHALWHLGLPDRALALNGESCELARAIGHAFSLGHALDFSALLTLYCGLDAEVLSAAAAELAIATEQGFQLWRALGTLHQAAGMLLREDYEHGLPLFVEGLRAFRATGAELRLPAYLGMLGQAYTQLGRLDEARMAIDEGLAIVEKNDDRCHEAELQRLSGELLLAESPEQFGAAEVWFRRAIETARRQQSQAWELRATMSLARLWQRQGHRQEAHAALSTVLGACSEDPATRDIIDAKALLAGLR
ncbi:MAG: AAA family ATPase [Planctomycetaceae bacterium]